MEQETIKKMIRCALEARRFAYTPYSHFQVGAALYCRDGEIIKGCNVENASYGATNCAERTAFFKAISEGKRDFLGIAIVGGPEGKVISDYAYPCGVCRQVMQEFGSDDFKIIVAKNEEEYLTYGLKDLLPFGFGGDVLV